MPYGAIAAAVIGAGTAVYSADKQRKLQHQAADQNMTQYDQANQTNLDRFNVSRGIGASGEPINVRLPQWARVTALPPMRRRVAGNGRMLGAPMGAPGYALPSLVRIPEMMPINPALTLGYDNYQAA